MALLSQRSIPGVSMSVLPLESQAASPKLSYRTGPPLGYERFISQPSHRPEVRSPNVQAAPQTVQQLPAAPSLPPRSRSNSCHKALTPHRPQKLTRAHRPTSALGRTTSAIESAQAAEPQFCASRSGIPSLGGRPSTRYASPTAARLTGWLRTRSLLLRPSSLCPIRSAPEPRARTSKTRTKDIDKVRAPSPAMGGTCDRTHGLGQDSGSSPKARLAGHLAWPHPPQKIVPKNKCRQI
ncbi:hypothetical protein NDU88_003343 [Pleurodeles waltl]|uniref:Uncharacterized protein n=1 Tax=Pleurodeles waltl TaxID=8319 RepID=A0AAV7V276_PLEWA|nr:hypothetical protein NDU88_003343 [Pleurodeles waltl]